MDARQRLRALGVRLEDVLESFARSGGAGGQGVNKVESAVTLTHAPSGMVIRVTDTRSQAQNRELAWDRLAFALETRELRQKQARRHAAEKERRKKRKRPKGLKEKILKSKKHRAQIKKGRGRVNDDD